MGNGDSNPLKGVKPEESQHEFCSRLLDGYFTNKPPLDLFGLKFAFAFHDEGMQEGVTRYRFTAQQVEIPFETHMSLEKIFLILTILTKSSDVDPTILMSFKKRVSFLKKVSPSNSLISKLEFSVDTNKLVMFKSMEVVFDTNFDMILDSDLKIHVSVLTMIIDPKESIQFKTRCHLLESTVALFETNEHTWGSCEPSISASFTMYTKHDLKTIDPIYFERWMNFEPYCDSPWLISHRYQYGFSKSSIRLTESQSFATRQCDRLYLPRSGVLIDNVTIWPYCGNHYSGITKCIGEVTSRYYKDLQLTFGGVREIAPRMYPDEVFPLEELLVRDGLAPVLDIFGIDFCDTSYVPKRFDRNGKAIKDGLDDFPFNFTYDRGPKRHYSCYFFSLKQEKFYLLTSIGIEIEFEFQIVWKTVNGHRLHVLPSRWRKSSCMLKTLKEMRHSGDVSITFY